MQRIAAVTRADNPHNLAQVLRALEVVPCPGQFVPCRVEVPPLGAGDDRRRRDMPCSRSGIVGKMDELDPLLTLERAKIGCQGTVLAVNLHLDIGLTPQFSRAKSA